MRRSLFDMFTQAAFVFGLYIMLVAASASPSVTAPPPPHINAQYYMDDVVFESDGMVIRIYLEAAKHSRR